MKNSLPRIFAQTALFTSLTLSIPTFAAVEKVDGRTWIDPQLASQEHPGFLLQGEYQNGNEFLQVVPAEGRYYLSSYRGGLPGDGWDGTAITHQWLEHDALLAHLAGFKKLNRSARIGKPAPKNALILFDGSSLDEWVNGSLVDGFLKSSTRTQRSFRDFTLHFEFRTPYKPDHPLSHPDRGNSGVYIFNSYEVQIMDNFALDQEPEAWQELELIIGPRSWCGAIYLHRKANLNVSYPALSWQSFDIDFTAPRFVDGVKTENARLTVHQNGVLIHKDIEVPGGTGHGGKRPERATGPLHLQGHGNTVLFRNIWIIEK